MLLFGLKLLGLAKTLRQFFLANWKWIVPIIIIAASAWFSVRAINDMKRDAYSQGYNKKTEEVKLEVEEENRRNREFEVNLASIIDDYTKKISTENENRIKSETVHTETIKTIVQNNPVYQECVVDQSVTDARNEIRKLGPEN